MASWLDGLIKGFTGSDGDTDMLRGLVSAGGGYLLNQSGIGQANIQPTGYQGSVPEYEVQRQSVPGTYNPDRRAGSGGQRYFTDTQYVPKSDTPAAPMSAEGLAALNAANPAQEIKQPVTTMAAGGIAELKKGQYLSGSTDGMADKIPARIEGEQEARLSDGEFVIPADVVSHLGNGNSDAGAKVLKEMMARVRKTRTGNEKQGKEIDPKKFLPA
jgi:hypothetical protein|tara:strand:- start:150 stop:794 length:645 start_codon:yes stop_codon:yes gene_type:complete